MTFKRLWQSFRLCTIRGSAARTEYLRKQNVFAAIGKNCTIQKRKIPLYANLIRLGNNVHIASGVSFLTHDVTCLVLNHMDDGKTGSKDFNERVGCIEIGDNVFIGSSTRIMYDTRIGSNVIIGTGSIVTKDIPDNSVAAGVPAKVIGSFDDFVEKYKNSVNYPAELKPRGQVVSDELARLLWKEFDEKHKMGEK